MTDLEKERLFETLDKISDRINEVEKTLVKQEANLSEHMKRTELAEENLQLLREELKPLEKHVYYIEGAFKLVGGIGVIVSLVVGFIKILTFLGQ